VKYFLRRAGWVLGEGSMGGGAGQVVRLASRAAETERESRESLERGSVDGQGSVVEVEVEDEVVGVVV
jgi:hypothetical protein